MRQTIICILLLFGISCFSQNKTGTTFDGTIKGDPAVCESSKNFMPAKDVENMVTEMLNTYGIRNRYFITPCAQIENCQAVIFNGKPYILYNPEFLSSVKKLNFTTASLPEASNKDWEVLTVLAHELGHHINNHLINPLPDASSIDMELEADETAGYMLYMIGCQSLAQAQSVFLRVSEKGSLTHPSRASRLQAVERGYREAMRKHPNPGIKPNLNTVGTLELKRSGGNKQIKTSNFDAANYDQYGSVNLDDESFRKTFATAFNECIAGMYTPDIKMRRDAYDFKKKESRVELTKVDETRIKISVSFNLQFRIDGATSDIVYIGKAESVIDIMDARLKGFFAFRDEKTNELVSADHIFLSLEAKVNGDFQMYTLSSTGRKLFEIKWGDSDLIIENTRDGTWSLSILNLDDSYASHTLEVYFYK